MSRIVLLDIVYILLRVYGRENFVLGSNFRRSNFDAFMVFGVPLNSKITFLEVILIDCVSICVHGRGWGSMCVSICASVIQHTSKIWQKLQI